ncbi:hypothetical protein [Paenibacillus antibioticophila]|uniref:hypothetical protein n=1 Tax=Paenibacillus antibioticophila TaxID=1274374 RepID=UPI0005CA3DE4|nr:hypothetical protein [Paenibacillus antibioticophila]
MSFKDQLAQDIETVFFNYNEFADEAIIDGKKQIVIIDDEQLKKRAEKEYIGISAGLLLYFIPKSALDKEPAIGDVQKFNNKLYYVEDVKEVDNVYEIVLNTNRGE